MVMVVVMCVAMAVAQEQRTDDIDHQAHHRDQGGGAELHLGRVEQAHHRLHANPQRHQRQDQRRGKAAEIADLARAEAVARAVRVPFGIGVSGGGDAQGAGVGGHVKTVGEQSHGTGDGAGGDFHNHHHHGQQHDPQGAPGIFIVGGAEEHMGVGMAVGEAHLE